MKNYGLKSVVILTIILLPIFTNQPNTKAQTDMHKYCTVPPFIGGQSVSPNVLLAVDVSGSMGWCAYNPDSDGTGCCYNLNGCGWTYKGNEEGYFDPEKVYHYDLTSWMWVETTGQPNSCPNNIFGLYYGMYNPHSNYKGSCLNFLLMRRIDLVKWAMTGGKPFSCWIRDVNRCDPETYGNPESQVSCDDEGCILSLYNGYTVKVPWERINDGLLFKLKRLKTSPRMGVVFFRNNGIVDKVYIGDFTSSANFDGVNPYKNTITHINYISPDGSTPTGPAMWDVYNYFAQNDPQYGGFTPQQGEGDKWRNPMYQCFDYNNNSICEGNELQQVWCAKNFVILMSDGQWNTGATTGRRRTTSCSIDDGFEDSSSDPVVPSYWLHKKGFTNSKTGVKSNVEAVYGIGMWLGGTGKTSLENVAMYGSFDTSHGDWPDELDNYPQNECGPIDDCCGRYNCGKGSSCTPLPPSSPDWDQDGDHIPDTFFSASNAKELKSSIENAMWDILKRASSGTSTTVLSERTQAGATMLQALFYPEKVMGGIPIQWVGYLNTLWLYKGNTGNSTAIREDTVHDYILDLKEDYIIHFLLQDNSTLIVNRCQDTDGDGLCDAPQSPKNLDDLTTVFEEGHVLQDQSATSRNIFTYNGIDFSEDHASELQEALLMENQEDTKKLINYIRGEDYAGWRNRTTGEGKVWKLGDIIYSTPKVVSYEDYAVIIVGANDGMLHAFKLGKKKPISSGYQIVKLCDSATGTCTQTELGKELWAYIPGNLLPYLRYLKEPDYCHLYYVDLTPFVFTYTDSQNTEHKILIGGMRLGGACNCTGEEDQCVTPPADANGMGLSSYFALDITNPTSPQFLWEFTNSDLGFTYSGPAVFSIGGHPVVAFLSGPTHYDGESTQNLKVFILTLDPDTFAIQNTQIIDTGKTNAFGGRLFVNKIGVDSALANRVFFGYTQKASGSWKGGVYKLELSYDTNNQSIVPTLTEVITDIGPITGGVREGTCQQSSMIYFGEGRYFTGSQDDPTAIRRLYGVSTQCNGCTLSDLSNSTRLDSISSGGGNGWYIELYGRDGGYNAERTITDPLVYAKDYNVVFFTTFQPTADICGFGGRTFEFLTKCSNGGAIDSTDVSNIKGKLFLQVSTGQIKEFTASDLTNRRSEPVQGVPSEFPPTFVAPYFGGGGSGLKEGEIIHWLER